MDQQDKIRTTDQGERAFEDGLALLECLMEACDGRSTLPIAAVPKVLAIAQERFRTARGAFDHLAEAA